MYFTFRSSFVSHLSRERICEIFEGKLKQRNCSCTLGVRVGLIYVPLSSLFISQLMEVHLLFLNLFSLVPSRNRSVLHRHSCRTIAFLAPHSKQTKIWITSRWSSSHNAASESGSRLVALCDVTRSLSPLQVHCCTHIHFHVKPHIDHVF